MKVSILIGPRNHAYVLGKALVKISSKLRIFTSSPPWKWQDLRKCVTFVPMPRRIFSDFFSRSMTRKDREFDAKTFDRLASYIVGKEDILHGFANFSLASGKKQKKLWWKIFFG